MIYWFYNCCNVLLENYDVMMCLLKFYETKISKQDLHKYQKSILFNAAKILLT